MKSLTVIFCMLCFLTAGWTAEGVSAKEALQLLTKTAGADVTSKVVYISGPKGQDQPPLWLFVVRNSKGFFIEYNMTGKRFIGSRNVPGFAVGLPVTVKRWKVDSRIAFLTAEKVARKQKLGFDSTNYELRCAEFSDLPVWFMTLVDAQNRKVGEVTVSAETGAVLRSNFFPVPVAPASAPGAQSVAPAENATMWDKTKSTLSKGGEAVKQGAVKTGSTIKGWLNKLSGRQSAPEQYYYQPVR